MRCRYFSVFPRPDVSSNVLKPADVPLELPVGVRLQLLFLSRGMARLGNGQDVFRQFQYILSADKPLVDSAHCYNRIALDLFSRIANFSRLKKSVARVSAAAILLDLFDRRSGSVCSDGFSRLDRLLAKLAFLDAGGRDDFDAIMENKGFGFTQIASD